MECDAGRSERSFDLFEAREAERQGWVDGFGL